MKIPLKILILITLATLLIWPCLGYTYDPKGITLGWYFLTLVIELLIILSYILFQTL
jgi:hypothetical protein